jgi:hypothetical protein
MESFDTHDSFGRAIDTVGTLLPKSVSSVPLLHAYCMKRRDMLFGVGREREKIRQVGKYDSEVNDQWIQDSKSSYS